MAIGEVVIDGDTKLLAQIGEITPRVRKALLDGLTPIAADMLADAKARASSHIRYLGFNPGVYVDQMRGGVASKDQRVIGYVTSSQPTVHFKGRDVPLAVLLEYGAHTPAHQILPSVAKALKFSGGVGDVFAKAVRHPGATMPALPAIHPAFEAKRGDIADVFEQVKIKANIER